MRIKPIIVRSRALASRLASLFVVGILVVLGASGSRSGAAERPAAPKPGIDDYYDRKEEGWFWKELIAEPVKEDPLDEPIDVSPPAPAPIVPMSPAWLREQLPLLKDRALENPSQENVRAYFYAQRYAMDMAERFALVAQQVTLTDPLLDENNRRPQATYAANVMDSEVLRRTEALAQRVGGEVGFWYFYRSDCPYCKAQNPVLMRLQEKYDLAVLPIALDGKAMPDGAFQRFVPNKGHAEQLKVVSTPTIYMVKKPNEFVLVSEGLVSEQAFVQRVIAGAHEAGWVSDEDYDSIQHMNPIVPLTPEQLTKERVLDQLSTANLR